MPQPDPYSPEWWVNLLYGRLEKRRQQMVTLDDYYSGRHPFPFVTKAHSAKMVNEFQRMLEESRTNFCRLVVDAVEERLTVEGIRLSAREDAEADEASWEIWQANQMDSESATAHLDALVKGVSYVSVWAPDSPDGYPTMAIEDPCETIVCYTPGSGMRKRDAALKVWDDDYTDMRRANLYLKDGIYKFVAKKPQKRGPGNAIANYLGGAVYTQRKLDELRWEPLDDPDMPAFVENPIGVVPIVPLRNRPRVNLEGESELADVTRPQNQINGFLFLMALAGYFGAHRQRWAVGIPLMTDDQGNAVEPFDSATDKLWTAEHPDVKFGEFEQTDLTGYRNAIEQKVLHIAVTTRTPRHYLIEQGQSPSGDAIKSAESGLVKKTERKQRPFGEGWEEALGLARRFAGETDTPVDSEIVWGDASTPTEAETTDAVIKKFTANLIPREQALEDLGYTQTQIARMAAQLQADELVRMLTAPVTPPPPNAGSELEGEQVQAGG